MFFKKSRALLTRHQQLEARYGPNLLDEQLKALNNAIERMGQNSINEDLVTKFKALYTKLEEEIFLRRPKRPIKQTPYPTLLIHFTLMAEEINSEKPYTTKEANLSFTQLQKELSSKEPMSEPLNTLCWTTIGAVMGITIFITLVTLSISLALTGTLSLGTLLIPLFILSGESYSGIAVLATGALTGGIAGFFIAKEKRAIQERKQEDVDAIEEEVGTLYESLGVECRPAL